MIRLTIAALAFTLAAVPLTASAETSGGSRQVAGGGFMSTYVDNPYHDPRSLWSQHNRTGQILGAPMLSENAGAPIVSGRSAAPRWTTGTAPARRAAR